MMTIAVPVGMGLSIQVCIYKEIGRCRYRQCYIGKRNNLLVNIKVVFLILRCSM